MSHKYKIGDVVIFLTPEGRKLGVIKNMFSTTGILAESHPVTFEVLSDGAPDGMPLFYDDVEPLVNAESYTILRRTDDPDYDLDSCKRMACEILDKVEDIVLEHVKKPLFDNYADDTEAEPEEHVEPGILEGLDYYSVEDEIRAILMEATPLYIPGK